MLCQQTGSAAMRGALWDWVASLTPGTCRERLWLLPSGPDQVHRAAMRGDPPRGGIVTARASAFDKKLNNLPNRAAATY